MASHADDPPPELVQRAAGGDAAAVQAILAHCLPGLVGYLRKNAGQLLQARETCEDLAQSVCREILESLRDARLEYRGVAEFRQWLYQTAFHKITNRRRYYEAERRAPGRELPTPSETSTASASKVEALFRSLHTPSADASFREELARFEAAFAQLPARYAEVIGLAYFERRSHAEIGARLGISEGNSRVLLCRALARLGKLGVVPPAPPPDDDGRTTTAERRAPGRPDQPR